MLVYYCASFTVIFEWQITYKYDRYVKVKKKNDCIKPFDKIKFQSAYNNKKKH